MVPRFSGGEGTGTSFAGAFAYYLHDKRTEEEREAGVEINTSNRVDWVEMQNMPTRDPNKAAGWMARTAKDQDRLKEAAGVPLTGRKSNKHVLAYSLAWSPNETVDKAEMMRAANESLRVLGAEGHQAAVISHNDTKHQHIHIIVNRVNAQDGRLLGLRQSQNKMQEWALAYERERGKVLCEGREAKEAAKQGKRDFVQAAKNVPPHMRPDRDFKQAVNENPDLMAQVKRQERVKDAKLASATADMRSRHTKNWKDLGSQYKTRNADIRAAAAKASAQAKAQHKSDKAPEWRNLFQKQQAQRELFAQREKRVTGKIQNALEAVAHAKVSRHTAADKGWMAAGFNFMRSSQAREQALMAAQKWERKNLSGQHRAELKSTLKNIREERISQLAGSRARFLSDRQSMRTNQKSEKTQSQQAWKTRNIERKAAFDTAAKAVQARKTAENRAKEAKAQCRAQTKQDRMHHRASMKSERHKAANDHQEASYAAAKGKKEFTGKAKDPAEVKKQKSEDMRRGWRDRVRTAKPKSEAPKTERKAEPPREESNAQKRHRTKQRAERKPRDRSGGRERSRTRAPSPNFGGMGGGNPGNSSGGNGGGTGGGTSGGGGNG